MHDVVLIAVAVLATLIVIGAFRLGRASVRNVAQNAREYYIQRTITLDDFEPSEEQADQIRGAVEAFERQRTPLITKPDAASPGGKTYDYAGPRLDAGRLFGVLHRGEIVMFYQWRGAPSEDPEPRKAIVKQFRLTVPGAVDADGWPVRPEKVFEINPGVYGRARDYEPTLNRETIHPWLAEELGLK